MITYRIASGFKTFYDTSDSRCVRYCYSSVSGNTYRYDLQPSYFEDVQWYLCFGLYGEDRVDKNL